jgi:tRNA dimethylallyltransferase
MSRTFVGLAGSMVPGSFSIFAAMDGKKHLLVVGGPTASGKTSLAIRLARKYTTEILSADSRQFFREMTIGTAPPSEEELAAAPHHFIGHRSVAEPYSVGAYERDALSRLEQLFQQQDLAILCGGSGLYIQAVCKGLDAFPEVPEPVRKAVEQDLETKGIKALQEELAAKDQAYHQEVDLANPHRLIRAISVIRHTGQPFSFFRKENQPPRPFTPIYLALQHDRQILYERIETRVDQMVAAGLEEEARRLYPLRHHVALQTVGYREWFDHFEGKTTREEAIKLIKQHTRNYAKRQLTWMRRDGFWKHFRPEETDILLPQYLERAIPESWQWSFDKSSGILCLTSGSAELAQCRLRFRKKELYASDFTGQASAKKWVVHEAACRASRL